MSSDIEFIGLGYCSNDYLCRVSEIPLDHKVEALEHLTQGGGPAATATVAAARLGMKTAFVGVAGDDESGQTIVKDLNAENVSTEAFRIRKRLHDLHGILLDRQLLANAVSYGIAATART